MKKNLVQFILGIGLPVFLAYPTNAQSQGTWVQQNSKVTKNLRNVYFVDSLVGWACGDSDIIIKTTDGGLNWTLCNAMIHDSTHGSISGMQFFSEIVGWVWSSNTLWKTTDGGSTWNLQYTGKAVNHYGASGAVSVQFTDTSNGWILTSSFASSLTPAYNMYWTGRLIQTIDGGKHWVPNDSIVVVMPFIGGNYAAFDFYFSDVDNGWFASTGIAQDGSGGSYPNSYCYDSYMATKDDGITWQGTTAFAATKPIYSPNKKNGFKKIVWYEDVPQAVCGMSDGPIFCARCESHDTVVLTNDGGQTWQPCYSLQSIIGSSNINAYLFDNNEGWILSNASLYFTVDAGQTWNKQTTPVIGARGMCFIDENTGWIVGDSGKIFYYHDSTPVSLRNNPHGTSSFHFSSSSIYAKSQLRLSFDLPENAAVNLNLYNSAGQLLRTTHLPQCKAGHHQVEFDGTIATRMAKGVYYCVLTVVTASTFQSASSKVIILR
jgi:photosystem II stability/assembly factor-like uncharacterized protein